MKKLLLLALVVLGGVMQASADDTVRRIWVQAGGNYYIDQISTKGNLCLYMWYGQSKTEVLGSYDNNDGLMTRLANTAFFYVDVTLPEEVTTASFIVRTANDHNWKSGDIEDVDVTGCKYFVWDESSSCTSNSFTYNLYSTNTNQAFTYSDGVFTCDLDQSLSTDDWYVIAPSFVLSFDDTNKWKSMYRPWSNQQEYYFNTYPVERQCGIWENSDNWKPKDGVNYKIAFKPNGYYTVSPYFERSVSSLGYATFSSTYDVAVDGATATYITGVGSGNVLEEASFTDGIKANTGALLYKDGGGTVTFTPAASTPTDVSATNRLVAVSANIDGLAQTADGKTNYILTNQTEAGKKVIGFYKANSDESNTVAAGKAYLSLPTAIASREFFWFGEEETTGISAIVKDNKVVEGYYNLNGQRIEKPAKGLYIVNGKKVIIK